LSGLDSFIVAVGEFLTEYFYSKFNSFGVMKQKTMFEMSASRFA
jgi:hypothetical protein